MKRNMSTEQVLFFIAARGRVFSHGGLGSQQLETLTFVVTVNCGARRIIVPVWA